MDRYITSLISVSARQQSVPELRHSTLSTDIYSTSTISRKTLQLPLDKCSSRFMKESAQNFLQIQVNGNAVQTETVEIVLVDTSVMLCNKTACMVIPTLFR